MGGVSSCERVYNDKMGPKIVKILSYDSFRKTIEDYKNGGNQNYTLTVNIEEGECLSSLITQITDVEIKEIENLLIDGSGPQTIFSPIIRKIAEKEGSPITISKINYSGGANKRSRYEKRSMSELRALANERKIKNVKNLTKEKLIEKIRQYNDRK